MLYFYSSVSIVNFEQVNVSWVLLNPSQVLKKGCEVQPFDFDFVVDLLLCRVIRD